MNNIKIPDVSDWHEKLYDKPFADVVLQTPRVLICPPSPKLNISDTHKYIGVIGRGEPLIMGDKLTEAIEPMNRGFALSDPDNNTMYSFTNPRDNVDEFINIRDKFKPPPITCRIVTDKQISKSRKKNKLAKQSRKRNRG